MSVPGAANETHTGGGLYVLYGGLPGGYLNAVSHWDAGERGAKSFVVQTSPSPSRHW